MKCKYAVIFTTVMCCIKNGKTVTNALIKMKLKENSYCLMTLSQYSTKL